MTAGTCPSRRTARAAPLPTRSRATALICFTALIWWSFVNFREKPKAALRRPNRKRPRLQGCERTRRLIRARAARRNAGSGRRQADPRVPVTQPAHDRQGEENHPGLADDLAGQMVQRAEGQPE